MRWGRAAQNRKGMSQNNFLFTDCETIEVFCDFCNSADWTPVVTRADGFTVVECLRCGLAYLNPRPKDEQIYNLYNRNYFLKGPDAQHSEIGYSDYEVFASHCLKKGKSSELDLIETVRSLKGALLLEIGCATGEMLALARQRGATTVGVEISEYGAQVARSRHNLEVKVGHFENQEFDCGTFDIVLALEVIEHVTSPTRFLKKISDLLKPGGLVALSTPNYRCSRRWGERWLGFQASFEHLYFLSDEVLMRLAAAHGFRTIFWATTGNGRVPLDKGKTQALKALIKKIPGTASLWQFLKGTFQKSSWELFGQGHRLFLLASKER